ncbi:hypothetical protein NP233_g7064 [Leucocoprinus birnbaumii]|uniref:Transaldolase n=1 Tax=Leucocoprinus birnbaumii TaxID=56174 RepID=A0AAD5VT71_9AGAR|nr:hypothetical protein NP233_g7064 [Leucocoprinus birnbaumii]
MVSAIDYVIERGITIAADGAEFSGAPSYASRSRNYTDTKTNSCSYPIDIEYSSYHATDATIDPSNVLMAVSQPGYSYLVEDAVHYTTERMPEQDLREQVILAMDYLLVQLGLEILNMIPGRVFVYVDPRVAYDYRGILLKARKLMNMFEEHDVPRERVVIMIPATYPGICAARALEEPTDPHHSSADDRPVCTNLTLVFGLVQAAACAQAHASQIFVFMGGVTDWALANNPSAPEDVGLNLVREIHARYVTHRNRKTRVMVADFPTVTLTPTLLRELGSRRNIEVRAVRTIPSAGPVLGSNSSERTYILQPGFSTDLEDAFMADLAREKTAVGKVPQAINQLIEDVCILEEKIKVQLMLARVKSSPTITGGWNIKFREVKL